MIARNAVSEMAATTQPTYIIREVFNVDFDSRGIAKNRRMMLRKEILKEAGAKY